MLKQQLCVRFIQGSELQLELLGLLDPRTEHLLRLPHSNQKQNLQSREMRRKLLLRCLFRHQNQNRHKVLQLLSEMLKQQLCVRFIQGSELQLELLGLLDPRAEHLLRLPHSNQKQNLQSREMRRKILLRCLFRHQNQNRHKVLQLLSEMLKQQLCVRFIQGSELQLELLGLLDSRAEHLLRLPHSNQKQNLQSREMRRKLLLRCLFRHQNQNRHKVLQLLSEMLKQQLCVRFIQGSELQLELLGLLDPRTEHLLRLPHSNQKQNLQSREMRRKLLLRCLFRHQNQNRHKVLFPRL